MVIVEMHDTSLSNKLALSMQLACYRNLPNHFFLHENYVYFLVFQILVGFGMGGWLMAQAAKERPHRVQAMVGIATWADLPGVVDKWAKPKQVMHFNYFNTDIS